MTDRPLEENINALIAEKIMGWKKDGCDYWKVILGLNAGSYRQGWLCPNDQLPLHERNHSSEYTNVGYPRNYRENIIEAFKVIEKLRERQIVISISQVYYSSEQKWEYFAKAEFYNEHGYDFEMEHGESVSKVICRVALRAIESQNNEGDANAGENKP